VGLVKVSELEGDNVEEQVVIGDPYSVAILPIKGALAKADPHYVNNPQSRRAQSKKGDASIAHLKSHVLHYSPKRRCTGGWSPIPHWRNKKNWACLLHDATFILMGQQTRRRPTTTSRCPCNGHRLMLPVHRSPPLHLPYVGHHLAPPLRKSLKKRVREAIHIVPAGREREENSRYLEMGKGGECS
jgi:hypothetical protein